MAELYDLSVMQAAQLIKRRELSPVDLTKSVLDRIDALEPRLSAWVTVVGDWAMAAAQDAERDIQRGEIKSLVHGVPFGAKDIFDTAGVLTACGSRVWADRVPTVDSAPVALLKRAGAVLLGKTVTTQFAAGDPAVTKNPWNAEHSPAGSSVGSGVAVAARMVPMALGSQTVGSVLRPAAYNGVVGFKPTFGRVSRLGVVPMSDTFDHVGVLVRTVEDAAVLLSVLAGHDPDDPASAEEPVADYVGALDQLDRPPRIGLLRGYFLDNADAETRLALEQTAQELARAGATVEELNPGIDFDATYQAHRIVQEAEMADWHKPLFVGSEDLYAPIIRAAIERGFQHKAVDYVTAKNLRLKTQRLAREALRDVDVVLTPTASTPAPRDLTITGDTTFQSPWTFTGFPSISVPMGLASNGLPLAVQFAAAPFDETTLLAAARWAERTLELDLKPPL